MASTVEIKECGIFHEGNKSLQMLDIDIQHSSVVEAVLKGAYGNTSLKKLNIRLYSDLMHFTAAAAELQQTRPQLKLHVY